MTEPTRRAYLCEHTDAHDSPLVGKARRRRVCVFNFGFCLISRLACGVVRLVIGAGPTVWVGGGLGGCACGNVAMLLRRMVYAAKSRFGLVVKGLLGVLC